MSFPTRLEGLLERACDRFGDSAAVADGRVVWSFAQLGQRVEHLASGLVQAGVRPGDRVAVLARNRADTVALYFAAARIDAVLLPLNQRLSAKELDWILRHCPPRVLCAELEFAERVQGTASELLPDGGRYLWDAELEGWESFEGLAPARVGSLPPAGDDSSACAVQMYTSGTTGHPKGAQLTHGNVLSLTEAWVKDMHMQEAVSRFLQVTPLFHVGGMLMVMSTVARGAALHLLPEFDPVAAIDTLIEQRITHTLMVPAMVQWCLLEPRLKGRSFPDLELMVYGASPMPVSVLTRAMEVFDCSFLQGYGLTESAGVLIVLRPEDHRWPEGEPAPERLASAGRAVACSEVRVVDGSGAPVNPGEIGEIVARGPNLTPGYYADSEASAEAFRGGWFHSGDLARVDAEGFIYVVDRVKDMILVGGENVYPREIEDVLMAHPAVADAAVIGVPHPVWGEQVLALVVGREGEPEPEGRALVRYCRGSLATFKCPAKVELRSSLPRNAAGKLQKRLLREDYWAGRERRV